MEVLRGKCAVVTGGSQGIGRAIVRRLARDGARVVFGYRQSADAASDLEQSLPGQVFGVAGDLAERDGVATLFARAAEHLDGLDIVVNNAAARFTPTALADCTDDEYDRVMAVNTRA